MHESESEPRFSVKTRALCSALFLVVVLAGQAPAQICGDCNMDGVISILDALVAAQIGAALIVPTAAHFAVCDVNSSTTIDVLDALRLAQEAAGIAGSPPVLTCMPMLGLPASCNILFPTGGTHGLEIPIAFETLGSPQVIDVLMEFSTNMGVSWAQATVAATSPLATNPTLGLSVPGKHFFLWNSLPDAGPLAVQGMFRVSIISSPMADCSSAFVVDRGLGLPPLPPGPGWLAISEIHADPESSILGDANGDGVRDALNDEFIEIVNIAGGPVSLVGAVLVDSVGVRHTFPGSVTLPAGGCIVVFGGGTPTGAFGTNQVTVASSGGLGLNNAGDTVTLATAGMTVIDQVIYGPEGDLDSSLVAAPEPSAGLIGGRPFVLHTSVNPGVLYSPGTQADCFTPRW